MLSMGVVITPCPASLGGEEEQAPVCLQKTKKTQKTITMKGVGTLQNTEVPLILRAKSGEVEYIRLI